MSREMWLFQRNLIDRKKNNKKGKPMTKKEQNTQYIKDTCEYLQKNCSEQNVVLLLQPWDLRLK